MKATLETSESVWNEQELFKIISTYSEILGTYTNNTPIFIFIVIILKKLKLDTYISSRGAFILPVDRVDMHITPTVPVL